MNFRTESVFFRKFFDVIFFHTFLRQKLSGNDRFSDNFVYFYLRVTPGDNKAKIYIRDSVGNFRSYAAKQGYLHFLPFLFKGLYVLITVCHVL